tara:strand:+ start:59 stop:241 length:183 start_codon:yes stop_codon:yes gene_type:complete
MELQVTVKGENAEELLYALSEVTYDIKYSQKKFGLMPIARTIGVMNSKDKLVGTWVIEEN